MDRQKVIDVTSTLATLREARDHIKGECLAADNWNNNEPGVGQTKDYKNAPWDIVEKINETIRELEKDNNSI